eukprot:scaffold911_cov162-Ochromonas_danica.AAC.8
MHRNKECEKGQSKGEGKVQKNSMASQSVLHISSQPPRRRRKVVDNTVWLTSSQGHHTCKYCLNSANRKVKNTSSN